MILVGNPEIFHVPDMLSGSCGAHCTGMMGQSVRGHLFCHVSDAFGRWLCCVVYIGVDYSLQTVHIREIFERPSGQLEL